MFALCLTAVSANHFAMLDIDALDAEFQEDYDWEEHRRRSGGLGWHLAPPGHTTCMYGSNARVDQCHAATAMLAHTHGKKPARSLQIGSGGSCMDGGWGQVPKGCSAQAGGDFAAHFKTSGGNNWKGCIHPYYRMVCSGPGTRPKKIVDPALVCKHGFELVNGKCQKVLTVGPGKVCPNGFELIGNECHKKLFKDFALVCEHGFELVNGKCEKCFTVPAKKVCPNGFELIGNECHKKLIQGVKLVCEHGFQLVGPLGNGKCQKVLSVPADMVCDDKFELIGDKCHKKIIKKAPVTVCKHGFKLVNGKCIKIVDVDPTKVCPDGFELIGNECHKKEVENSTLVCEHGFELVNGKCQRMIEVPVETVCPDGFELVGDECHSTRRRVSSL